jgi:hypothetical protein
MAVPAIDSHARNVVLMAKWDRLASWHIDFSYIRRVVDLTRYPGDACENKDGPEDGCPDDGVRTWMKDLPQSGYPEAPAEQTDASQRVHPFSIFS